MGNLENSGGEGHSYIGGPLDGGWMMHDGAPRVMIRGTVLYDWGFEYRPGRINDPAGKCNQLTMHTLQERHAYDLQPDGRYYYRGVVRDE